MHFFILYNHVILNFSFLVFHFSFPAFLFICTAVQPFTAYRPFIKPTNTNISPISTGMALIVSQAMVNIIVPMVDSAHMALPEPFSPSSKVPLIIFQSVWFIFLIWKLYYFM